MERWFIQNKSLSLDLLRMSLTEVGSAFVPAAEHIAVLDDDECAGVEETEAYFQLLFAMDRVKAMAADHPEWKTRRAIQEPSRNDIDALVEYSEVWSALIGHRYPRGKTLAEEFFE